MGINTMSTRLNEEERERLQEMLEELGLQRSAKKLQVSVPSFTRAASGAPIAGVTAALIRLKFQSDDRRAVIAERSAK